MYSAKTVLNKISSLDKIYLGLRARRKPRDLDSTKNRYPVYCLPQAAITEVSEGKVNDLILTTLDETPIQVTPRSVWI